MNGIHQQFHLETPLRKQRHSTLLFYILTNIISEHLQKPFLLFLSLSIYLSQHQAITRIDKDHDHPPLSLCSRTFPIFPEPPFILSSRNKYPPPSPPSPNYAPIVVSPFCASANEIHSNGAALTITDKISLGDQSLR